MVSTKPARKPDTKLAEKYRLYLRQMLLIRRFEEKAGEAYSLGKIGGFCHLYIGQEAVGVGCLSQLRPDDYIVTTYRDHGQALVRGISSRAVMAELFGKATGLCQGKGGKQVSPGPAGRQHHRSRAHLRPHADCRLMLQAWTRIPAF